MSEVENISLNQTDIESFISEFDDKINGFLSDLKRRSSDEILNGSVQKAQKLLDKLVLVEEGVDKVNSAHEYLLALLDQNETGNIDSKYINEKFRGKGNSQKKSEGCAEDKEAEKFRVPLLKALIYLGGSAEEDEIVAYIKKESKKLLSKEEMEDGNNGSEAGWINSLLKQADCMKEEELLQFDESRSQWEITQLGIDRLAKSDK